MATQSIGEEESVDERQAKNGSLLRGTPAYRGSVLVVWEEAKDDLDEHHAALSAKVRFKLLG